MMANKLFLSTFLNIKISKAILVPTLRIMENIFFKDCILNFTDASVALFLPVSCMPQDISGRSSQ